VQAQSVLRVNLYNHRQTKFQFVGAVSRARPAKRGPIIMVSTQPQVTSIPFKAPDLFSLFFLCMDEASPVVSQSNGWTTIRTDGSEGLEIGHSSFYEQMRWSQMTINPLSAGERSLIFEILDRFDLSEAKKLICRRSKAILSISAKNAGSIFSSFWACQFVAWELSQWIDCLIVDLHQGSARSSANPVCHQHWKGIPLTGTFLTVKAYPVQDGCYRLQTEGMSRFGLPELHLDKIPANLGSDGAYLLRSVAQYLWAKMEHVHPEQDSLTLASNLEISPEFFEYDNPLFQALGGAGIPIRLQCSSRLSEPTLEVLPTSRYRDYYDWLISVIQIIRDYRIKAQLKKETGSVDQVPETTAA
ncbi:MAG: hypothetical protein K2Z81_21000, partial [Cyanobacteria bacterium]|nr:hypothetical protein [Cyanobacteriota bacterium]